MSAAAFMVCEEAVLTSKASLVSVRVMRFAPRKVNFWLTSLFRYRTLIWFSLLIFQGFLLHLSNEIN